MLIVGELRIMHLTISLLFVFSAVEESLVVY